MSASDYQKRVQECLDMMERLPRRMRPLLLSIAEAWLALADEALVREERLDALQNAPSSQKIQ